MSLGKLLTSGKSLVGLQDPDSRYQMRSKNLLPKFGSDKNPFTKAKPQSLQGGCIEKVQTTSHNTTPAEILAARLKETKRLPAVTAIKSMNEVVSETSVKIKALSWMANCGRKVNPLAWWAGRKSKACKPIVSQFKKSPVQTELSLEKIKVIRNDLCEGDLEVVPVKISAKAQTEPSILPAVPAVATAELIQTD